MPHGRFPVGRRPVLIATAALLAGCEVPSGSPSSPSTGSSTGTASDTDPAGDEAVTTEVLTDLAAATTLADTIARRFPPLREAAAPFATLHRSHAAMLGDLPPTRTPRTPGARARARTDLLRQERHLQDRLVEAAGAAQSGALAQAFAAMAAAVAQQREVTP